MKKSMNIEHNKNKMFKCSKTYQSTRYSGDQKYGYQWNF